MSEENIWLQDGIHHDLIITDGTLNVIGNTYNITNSTVIIDNDAIDFEQFALEKSLCSQSQIQYGSCESGFIDFTMYENIGTVKNKRLTAYMIPNNDVSKIHKFGTFKVAEDQLTGDRTKRDIRAYDKMFDIINADVKQWYNTILPNTSTTVSLYQFRTSFLQHFGVSAISAALVNDDFTVRRTIEPETLSGGNVIRAICEMNGVFGTITNEDLFKYVELLPDLDAGLFPSESLYPANDLYPQDINPSITPVQRSHYIDIHFEDYQSEAITQLTVRTNEDDVGVTVGTPGNMYVITGNFLLYGCDHDTLLTVANNILSKIENRYYVPCTLEACGDPLREVGDGLRVTTQYRGVVTYILERRLRGIQGLYDTYTAKGTQYFDEKLNSITSQFKQSAGKITQLEVNVGNITGRVEDIEDGSASIIQQLSNEINARVTQNEYDSEVRILNNEISARVQYGEVSSQLSIESGQIVLESDRLVVHSTNFQLEANGNATFSGNITGATMTGGIITGAIIQSQSEQYGIAQISAGQIQLTSDSTTVGISARGGIGAVSRTSPYSSFALSPGYLRIFSGYLGHEVRIDGDQIYVLGGSITINGSSVLTAGDSISASQIYGQLDSSQLPSDVLTTSSDINANQIVGWFTRLQLPGDVLYNDSTLDSDNMEFYKYLSCHGSSGPYELTLQTVHIGDKSYVMYAYEK